jgi:hypothetical protein
LEVICWVENHAEFLNVLATLITALVIWWQAGLLRVQNWVDALIGLNNRWDSEEMLMLRCRWSEDETNLVSTESVLEFLEEFAALSPSVLKKRRVWGSVLGWYAAHYFFYNQANGNIRRIQDRWQDDSLYKELDRLFRSYLSTERRKRKIKEFEVCRRMTAVKQRFTDDERGRYALISLSPN